MNTTCIAALARYRKSRAGQLGHAPGDAYDITKDHKWLLDWQGQGKKDLCLWHYGGAAPWRRAVTPGTTVVVLVVVVVVVGCWLLVVGCWLLFVVCCLLFVVCCLLFVVCCLLFVGCWLLVVGCWLLVVGCWLLFVVCCLLFVVCCLLFVVVVVVVVLIERQNVRDLASSWRARTKIFTTKTSAKKTSLDCTYFNKIPPCTTSCACCSPQDWYLHSSSYSINRTFQRTRKKRFPDGFESAVAVQAPKENVFKQNA